MAGAAVDGAGDATAVGVFGEAVATAGALGVAGAGVEGAVPAAGTLGVAGAGVEGAVAAGTLGVAGAGVEGAVAEAVAEGFGITLGDAAAEAGVPGTLVTGATFAGVEGAESVRSCTCVGRTKRPELGGQSKYRTPFTDPSFLPFGVSSCTPTQIPV